MKGNPKQIIIESLIVQIKIINKDKSKQHWIFWLLKKFIIFFTYADVQSQVLEVPFQDSSWAFNLNFPGFNRNCQILRDFYGLFCVDQFHGGCKKQQFY